MNKSSVNSERRTSFCRKTFNVSFAIGLLLVGVFCVSYVIDKNIDDMKLELDQIVSEFETRLNSNFRTNRFSRSIRKRRSPSVIETLSNEETGETGIGSGVVYYRWGRRDCSGPSTKFIYEGIGTGALSTYTGGPSNALCMVYNVSYADGHFVDGTQGGSRIYGMEFADTTWIHDFFNLSLINEKKLQYQSVPCAACLAVSRFAKLMIPSQATCPQGWTKEYTGYIMGNHYTSKHSSEAICVDETPQVVPGTSGNNGGSLLYLAEALTGSLPSEPYVNGREIRCVVCTI